MQNSYISVDAISIHAPPRGATSLHFPSGTVQAISIHAPPRGATDMLTEYSSLYQFQFTPLREGRRGSNDMWRSAVHISIHAPPRGATRTVCFIASCPFISIHAPPRGATTLGQKALKTGAISIHAPPRGATIKSINAFISFLFQFTPLREGRRGWPAAT